MRSRLSVLVLVLALIAAACGGSTTTAGGDTDAPGVDEAVEPLAATTGAPLDPFDPANDTAIGQLAPNINVNSLNSEPISINQADGRGKVYAFFAHWCPHCQDEVPFLVSYLDANGLPDNVDFYAVSTAVDVDRDNYPPVSWFDAEKWPYEVMSDTAKSEVAQTFGLTGFPYFVIVGGDGTVVERIGGGLPDDAAVAAVLETAAASAT